MDSLPLIPALIFIGTIAVYSTAFFWGLMSRKLITAGFALLVTAFALVFLEPSLGTGLLTAILSIPAAIFIAVGALIAALLLIRKRLAA
jgi:hypothetical protein